MAKEFDLVGMGDVTVGKNGGELNCMGVGSGIVIAAFDPCAKVGACAHLILPCAPDTAQPNRPGKYVNTGIAELVRIMLAFGAEKESIRVALAGGSSFMPASEATQLANLGKRNLEATQRELEEHGLTCMARDVGGQEGRSVTLSTRDGEVRVRTSIRPDHMLCKLKG